MAAGGGVGLVGAEHAHQLADHAAAVELGHGRARRLPRGVLDDREVAIGQRGDLREVGDADDLAGGGEVAQLLADGAGDILAEADRSRGAVEGIQP